MRYPQISGTERRWRRLIDIPAIVFVVSALAGCGTAASPDTASILSSSSPPTIGTVVGSNPGPDKTESAKYCQLLSDGDWVTNDSAYSTTPCVPDPAYASGDEQADASRAIPRCFSCKLSDWNRAEKRAAQRSGQSWLATDTSTTGTDTTNLGSWTPGLRRSFVSACSENVSGALCQCLANHLARQVPAAQTGTLSAEDPRVQADVKTCQS